MAPATASDVSYHPPAFIFIQHTFISFCHLLDTTQNLEINKVF